MRKYFLLITAALLMATNVNAQNMMASGNFQAIAILAIADEIKCEQNLLFTALFKSNEVAQTFTVNPDGTVSGGGDSNTLSYTGTPATCTIQNGTFTNVDNFELLGGDTYNMYAMYGESEEPYKSNSTVSNFTFKISDDGKSVNIGATFNIAKDFESAQYVVDHIPLSYLYE